MVKISGLFLDEFREFSFLFLQYSMNFQDDKVLLELGKKDPEIFTYFKL